MVSFIPVVERTSVESKPPWPVLDDTAAYRIPLSADATDADIGSVIWQLAQYNGIPIAGRSALEIVQAIASAESLVLPGGIVVRGAAGREIIPGCCAGLEEWREWLAFEETGQTPWTGHDPDPWLERDGDAVRIWSHGDLSDTVNTRPYAIEVPIVDFRSGLLGVEHNLLGFLGALRLWAGRHVPEDADAFAARFDQVFEITGR